MTEALEVVRPVSTKLEIALADHNDALATWREIEGRERQLEQDRLLKRGGGLIRVEDEPSLIAARADLADEKVEAARALSAAVERLRQARLQDANAQLERIRPRFEEKAARVAERVEAFEDAYLALAVAAAALVDARQEETVVASEVVRIASPAAPDDGVRATIRAEVDHQIPFELGEAGVTWRDRDERQVFGGWHLADPIGVPLYAALAGIAKDGVARADSYLPDRVAERLSRLERRQSQ